MRERSNYVSLDFVYLSGFSREKCRTRDKRSGEERKTNSVIRNTSPLFDVGGGEGWKIRKKPFPFCVFCSVLRRLAGKARDRSRSTIFRVKIRCARDEQARQRYGGFDSRWRTRALERPALLIKQLSRSSVNCNDTRLPRVSRLKHNVTTMFVTFITIYTGLS